MAERTLLQRAEHAGPLTWLLAGVAGWAALLWAAALFGMGGNVAATTPAASTALPQAKPVVPDRIGPLAQYAEAAARPLFTQDRRPRSFLATGPEGDTTAQSQTLDFILTGVLISPQVRLAVLQPSAGGEAQRVQVGKSPEGADGWRLVDVAPRRAVFEGAGGQIALELRNFGDAAMPPSGMAVPVPPPPQAAPANTAASAPPQRQDVMQEAGQSQEARIEAIRKRIEARRAQLRGGQNGGSASGATPPKP